MNTSVDNREAVQRPRDLKTSPAIDPLFAIAVCVVGMEIGGAALIIGTVVLWWTTCAAFSVPFQAALATTILSLGPKLLPAGAPAELAGLLDISPGVPMILDGLVLIVASIVLNIGSGVLWDRHERPRREEATRRRLAAWDEPASDRRDRRATTDVLVAAVWRGLERLRTSSDPAFSGILWFKMRGDDCSCCRLRFVSSELWRRRVIDLVVRASELDAIRG